MNSQLAFSHHTQQSHRFWEQRYISNTKETLKLHGLGVKGVLHSFFFPCLNQTRVFLKWGDGSGPAGSWLQVEPRGAHWARNLTEIKPRVHAGAIVTSLLV